MPDELFHVEMVNLKPFAARLRGARPVVEQELLTATDRLTLFGEGEAKRRVRVKRGHLRRSITRVKAVMVGGTATGRYGTNVKHARWIEFGRGPVRARNAQALRFVIGGRVLYRKSVGPAPAFPYMRPSFQLVKQRAPQEYRMAMSRIIQRIGGGR